MAHRYTPFANRNDAGRRLAADLVTETGAPREKEAVATMTKATETAA